MKQTIFLLSIALTAIAANAAPINFKVVNNEGGAITLYNPTPSSDGTNQSYIIPNGDSFSIPQSWTGLNGSYDKMPMKISIKKNNTTNYLCSNLPSFNKYSILNMPKANSTLTVAKDGTCTTGNPSSAGKLLSNTVPDIGQVIMGKDYLLKSNSIMQLGLYISSTSPVFDYKTPGLAIHYTATGLPKGLSIPAWGAPDFNADENGNIYGTATSTKGCSKMPGHTGYYKCSITITAKEDDKDAAGKPVPGGINQTVTNKFNLYLYNGLHAKSLTDLAEYNSTHTYSPIRLNIGINKTSKRHVINFSKLFSAYNKFALIGVKYTISDSKDLSPINIVNQKAIPLSSFKISHSGRLNVKNLPMNSITQFTVVAKNDLGQAAKQTLYINVSKENKHGVPIYTSPKLLPAGTGAWVYGASNSCVTGVKGNANCKIQNGYINKLNKHNITYMKPDMGYLMLTEKDGKNKVWNMNIANPINSNLSGDVIKETAQYYKSKASNTKFLLTIEFDRPLLGILPSLTNASVPGQSTNSSGQNTNQLQTLEDSIVNGLNASENDGMQFDLEPFSAQPRNLQFYKNISDRLARQGKIFQIYAFANAMTPALALAASPLTVWLPSAYDVGGPSDPKQYKFDTRNNHYLGDTVCHSTVGGVNGYNTNSWCSLNVADAKYQDDNLYKKLQNQPSFSDTTSTYGIHFQISVPAEGSALNWSRLKVYNPKTIDGTNYADIVAGQQPVEEPVKEAGNYVLFESNKNKSTNQPTTTQDEFIKAFIKSASDSGLGTPKTNHFNLGLALYAISNEGVVNGCFGGDKSKNVNCAVQEPVSISDYLPKFTKVQSLNGDYKVSIPVIDSHGKTEYSKTVNPVWTISEDYLKGVTPK